MHRSLRPIAAVIGATALLVMAPTAHAQSPREIDPGTLTPALNPTFTWSCAATGEGVLCQGERHTLYGPEPAGFDCDGRPVHVTGRGDDRSTRWHTADGRAIRTISQRSFDDRFTLAADGSGDAVTSTQRWNQHFRYGTPGDASTRVLTETGKILMVHSPDGGKLLQYTGYAEFAPGQEFETLVAEHGRNDFAAGVDFVEAVCDALT